MRKAQVDSEWWGWVLILGVLALGYWVTRDFVTVGRDDHWEILKVHFAVREPELLPRVWNDQPWLHTLLNARLCQWLGEGLPVMRLFTVGSVAAMWAAVVWLGRGALGFVGVVSAALLVAGWRYGMPLQFSFMLEPAAWSWAFVAAGLLYRTGGRLPAWQATLSGAVMGAAMQMKLTAVLVAPGLVLLCWRVYGLRESLRLVVPWGLGWAASFGLVAWLSPNFRWDWLLGSHWAANQAAETVPGLLSGARWPWSTPDCLVALVAGGFGLLGLRRLGWPPVGVFAVGVLVGALLFRAVARLWWDYYELHFVWPLSILGGLGIAEAVRILRWQWSGQGRAGGEGISTLVLPSTRAVGRAVLVLSSVPALWVGVGLGLAAWEWNKIHSWRSYAEPMVRRHLQATATTNRWCYGASPFYREFAQDGVFPPPELLILPPKRFWSGQITWEGVATCLETNRVPLLLLLRDLELQESTFVSWLTQHYAPVEFGDRTEVWHRLEPGKPRWEGKETRLGGR